MLTGGLLPFPRTGCVLYARAILPYRTWRDEKGEEMEPDWNRTGFVGGAGYRIPSSLWSSRRG